MTEERRDFRITGPKARSEMAALDATPWDELILELGQPDRLTTTFFEGVPVGVIEDGRKVGETVWWRPGDQRPALATEDIAVIQAIGRHLTWEATLHGSVPALEGIHPGPCNWCEYPTAELRSVVGWASYLARWVDTERATWDGRYGSRYERSTPRQSTYLNPKWADWFADEPDRHSANDRRRAEIERAMYGQ